MTAWCKANPTKVLIANAREVVRYHVHHRSIRQRKNTWVAANRDKVHASYKRWAMKNLKQLAAKASSRRARIAQSPLNDLTAAQWQEIKTAYQFRCVYCHLKTVALTQDHIIPISKGGPHMASNIVPACRSCNSRKSNGVPLVPVQPLLLTIALPKQEKKPS